MPSGQSDKLPSAMILAAGRGERMRPLTDTMPKPMLPVAGKALIEHHVEKLVDAGFRHLVINTAHLGEQIEACLGQGERFGIEIDYSREGQGQALETGGGIFRALPLFRGEVFAVINGDVWTDYDVAGLHRQIDMKRRGFDAHLILVSNPAHNPDGDFCLQQGLLHNSGSGRLTFSGLGVYHRDFFSACRPGAFPLAPMLREAIDAGQVSGEQYGGCWIDVGTPQRLAELDNRLRAG